MIPAQFGGLWVFSVIKIIMVHQVHVLPACTAIWTWIQTCVKRCAVREYHERICFAFALVCEVGKTPKLSPMAEDAITQGGIGSLVSLVYICGLILHSKRSGFDLGLVGAQFNVGLTPGLDVGSNAHFSMGTHPYMDMTSQPVNTSAMKYENIKNTKQTIYVMQLKQNELELTNINLKYSQTKQIISLFFFCNHSKCYFSRANCPISMGFSPN